jgi:peroxiredoxin
LDGRSGVCSPKRKVLLISVSGAAIPTCGSDTGSEHPEQMEALDYRTASKTALNKYMGEKIVK